MTPIDTLECDACQTPVLELYEPVTCWPLAEGKILCEACANIPGGGFLISQYYFAVTGDHQGRPLLAKERRDLPLLWPPQGVFDRNIFELSPYV